LDTVEDYLVKNILLLGEFDPVRKFRVDFLLEFFLELLRRLQAVFGRRQDTADPRLLLTIEPRKKR
jgi:hypothetical protein